MWTVYGLVDTLTGATRYVGLSQRPGARFAQHLARAKEKEWSPMRSWLWRLREHGRRPEFVILGLFYEREEARDAEGRFAGFARRSGYDLLNERGPFVSGTSAIDDARFVKESGSP